MKSVAPDRPPGAPAATHGVWSTDYLLRHCEGFVVHGDEGCLGYVEDVVDAGDAVVLLVHGKHGHLRIGVERVRYFDPHTERIAITPEPGAEVPEPEPLPEVEPTERRRRRVRRGLRVEDVMTTDVVTVRPQATLRQVAHALVEHRIAGVPVCDDEGHVLGVVSEGDILFKERGADPDGNGVLTWLLDPGLGLPQAKLEARTAGEAMSQPAITIGAGKSVAEAARTMIDRGVNRLPVVARGRLVGIVARSDLVRAFDRSDAELEREIRNDVILGELWVDPSGIDVTVHDGEVSLQGAVETRTEAELVLAYVRRVPGVVSVDSTALAWRHDDLARRLGRTQVRV